MSNDLVKRLRAGYCNNNDTDEAADRIEDLEADAAAWKGVHEGAVAAMQARIDQLEAALEKIAQHDMQAIAIDALHPGERIRKALEEKDE